MRTKAVYAGSFDPMTKGHWDIVEQALKVFDELIIGVGRHPTKQRTFDASYSIRLIEHSAKMRPGIMDRISVMVMDGALVRFAEANDCTAIVRGLRQISDFSDEFTQHGVNTRLSDLPITYFICHSEFLHVSSSTAKMITALGEDVSWMVDDHVAKALLVAQHTPAGCYNAAFEKLLK